MKKIVLLSFVFLFAMSIHLTREAMGQESTDAIKNSRHLQAFYAEGRFAAWPANNGMWQWEDEILVGFTLGYLAAPEDQKGLHQINRSWPNVPMFIRSLDGGETWTSFEANYPTRELKPFPAEIPFDSPGFTLNARRNQACISLDKGYTWQGPFRLPFADLHLVARTDYQVLGPDDLMLFLTAQKTNDREGRPYAARTRTGGKYWNQFAWIGDEPETGYSIMPSSVRLPNGDFLAALRRQDKDPEEHNFIELFRSQDGGLSWQWLVNPVESTGGRSGNPPSMLRLQDGRLCITYANRDKPHTIRAVFSNDDGMSWGNEYIIRSGAGEPDIGYTRTAQRSDGKLVTIYYWLDKVNTERYIAATIWDPAQF